jgi:hypothetical protein
VLHDNPLHDRQAHARSFKFLNAVQSLEDPEEFVCELHVKTDPIVANVVRDPFTVFFGTDVDERGRCGATELDRIGEEVHPHLPQKRRVSIGVRQLQPP